MLGLFSHNTCLAVSFQESFDATQSDQPPLTVLDTYERTHSDVILDAADHETLRKLCEQHTDLELGPQELLHFLT